MQGLIFVFSVVDLGLRFSVWSLDFRFENIFKKLLNFDFKFKTQVILWKDRSFKV